MAKVLSEVFSLKTGWIVGYIEDHVARAMTQTEVDAHVAEFIALRLALETATRLAQRRLDQYADEVSSKMKYLNALTDEIAARQTAERERDEATQELAMVKAAYLSACGLVASMHAAAVGEVRGPTVGPVGDVAALKAERDALLSRPAPPADAATEAAREWLRHGRQWCKTCLEAADLLTRLVSTPAPAPSAKETQP